MNSNPVKLIMKKRKSRIISGLIILVIALFVYYLTKDNSIRVEVAEASLKQIVEQVPAEGKVVALDKQILLSESGGTVTTINVKLGEQVKAGQVLAEIHTPKALENLTQAEANLSEAQSDLSEVVSGGKTTNVTETEAALREAENLYNIDQHTYIRSQTLYENGAISVKEFEQAQSDLNISTAKLEKAKEDYQRAKDKAPQYINSLKAKVEAARIELESAEKQANGQGLICPRDGKVLTINVCPGDIISENTALMTISSLAQLQINGYVPEMEATKIKIGQKVNIRGNGFSNLNYLGKVVEVGLALTSDSQSQNSRDSLPIVVKAESMEGILPGFNVNLDITTTEMQTLTIPIEALVEQDEGNSVWLINDGIAHLVPVISGISDGFVIQIISGLETGDKVIVNPIPGMLEGTRVRFK